MVVVVWFVFRRTNERTTIEPTTTVVCCCRYVLMVELVLNAIALALIALCIIFGAVAVVAFSKPSNI